MNQKNLSVKKEYERIIEELNTKMSNTDE